VVPDGLLAAELIDHARSKVASYKAPRSVDFVNELPRTPTGKLVKRVLKERYALEPAPWSPL